MSTPQVPQQPGQDPQFVPPPSDTGSPRYGAQPGYAPQQAPGPVSPQYNVPPPYSPPGQYPPPSGYSPPGQYPVPGQYGFPVPPPAKSRKLLWIILGVVGIVLALVIVGVVILVNVVGNATNKARNLSDDFTRLLVNGQSEQAYDQYLHPSLMQNLEKEDFVAGVASLELDNSCAPHYDSVNVTSVNGTNTADVTGTLQCAGKNIQLKYSFIGSDLKMEAISLKPKG